MQPRTQDLLSLVGAHLPLNRRSLALRGTQGAGVG
jgi:hypothetical protein